MSRGNMAHVIGSSISHYKVLAKLGEGGMGVVYKAEDTRLERSVALKFLPAHLLGNEEVRKRFEREAKSAASLDHPNVCHVYEIDEVEGKTFISMSLIEGVSLDQKIAEGPLKLDEALSIGQQIAKGLDTAHKRGIIHRDIKPENIMVGEDGHVTIMDFGLAQLTEASRLTKTDETVGTVAYMSPEQTDGSGTDHRTDIWSLGVVLYEMVTGRQPFQGDYDKAVMYSILNEEPEPITGLRSGVPMQLEDYAGKCLAKDKADRYQDLSHLILDLKGLQRQVESGRSRVMAAAKAQPGPEPTVQQSVGTNRAPWAVAFLLGLVAAGLAFLLVNAPELERPVRRFSFTPDSLADRFAAAVSPDGKQIVYVSGDTPPVLWVRSLDDESPRKLAGTEGAKTRPFWSPDSKMIAFAAEGAIKKIPAVGGTATVLCDYFGGFTGGAWSPDGQTLVVSFGSAVSFLRSVPDSGGEPKDLFETRARSEKGASNLEPHFLPSEQSAGSMLFTAGVSEHRDVFLLNGRTGETQLLFEGAAPFYAEGYIIYLPQALQPGLWAVPFSLETLSVTGEAFPLAEGVEGAGAAADGTLVTMDRDAPAGQVLVWRDRSGKKLAEIGRPLERIRSLELSPDGTKVAAQGSVGGDRELWIHDADRQVAQKLTFGDQSPRFPAWSPDGGTLVYSEVSDGRRTLFEIPADGGGTARQIIEAPREAMEMYPSRSRDGRYIVYAYGDERSSGRDLWLVDRGIDGAAGQARPFLEAPFNQSTPQISPDSTLVAYTSNETGVDEVYVRGLPDGALQVQVSENGGGQPRWSRDGKELFFTRGQDLMAVDVSIDPDLRIGTAERLFSAPDLGRGLGYNYDVAPDGRFLMVDSVDSGVEERRKPAIHVIQNWAEEFSARR